MPYFLADERAVFVRSGSDRSLCLIVIGSPEQMSLLRPHVFKWLLYLADLIWLFVTVEVRRLTWVQRMIHDVRQPLQGILALSTYVRELLLDTRISRRDISKNAEDMETSIMRLNVLFQIFDHRTGIEIQPSPRSIHIEEDVLRPMRRVLSPIARKKSIKISDTLDFGFVPSIQTDPDLLSVVFYNLLDNALKYSDADSEVTVRCSEEDTLFIVEITSTGLPISLEERERIFEEGFRGTAARGRDVGLGMGLYIARKIAQRLKCDLVLVEAAEGSKKVTFQVKIGKELTRS
jgi:signal transduction histidine kinase